MISSFFIVRIACFYDCSKSTIVGSDNTFVFFSFRNLVLFPFQEVLYVAAQDMQVTACSTFLQALQMKLVPVPAYTTTFLPAIITGLANKDQGDWIEKVYN